MLELRKLPDMYSWFNKWIWIEVDSVRNHETGYNWGKK